MPQYDYRANLSAAIFPFRISDAGMSVIDGRIDGNFDRRLDPSGEQSAVGVPQAIYLENTIPTVQGYQSIGWQFLSQGTVDLFEEGILYYLGAYVVPAGNFVGDPEEPIIVHFFCTTLGLFYYKQATSASSSIPTGVLTKIITFGGLIASPDVTSFANVRGKLYFHTGVQVWQITADVGLATLVATNATPSVLPVGFLNGAKIVSFNNYLVAYKEGEIFWSSTIDGGELDFTPSLVTGAGNLKLPYAATGNPKLEPSARGFYLFGLSGALYFTYTGNARYPFKVVPVPNLDEVITFTHTPDPQSVLFGVTRSGTVFALEDGSASRIAPELTSYLQAKADLDVFDTATNTFTSATKLEVLASYNLRISRITDRYLAVSCFKRASAEMPEGFPAGVYEQMPFAQTFIYDIGLRRYGKLNRRHTQILDWVPGADPGIVDTAYQLFERLVLRARRELPLAEVAAPFDIDYDGVLVLGRFQLRRGRRIELQEVVVERVQTAETSPAGTNFKLYVIPSDDGGGVGGALELPPVESGGGKAVSVFEGGRAEGQNISLLLKGAYNLSTVAMTVTTGGGR